MFLPFRLISCNFFLLLPQCCALCLCCLYYLCTLEPYILTPGTTVGRGGCLPPLCYVSVSTNHTTLARNVFFFFIQNVSGEKKNPVTFCTFIQVYGTIHASSVGIRELGFMLVWRIDVRPNPHKHYLVIITAYLTKTGSEKIIV